MSKFPFLDIYMLFSVNLFQTYNIETFSWNFDDWFSNKDVFGWSSNMDLTYLCQNSHPLLKGSYYHFSIIPAEGSKIKGKKYQNCSLKAHIFLIIIPKCQFQIRLTLKGLAKNILVIDITISRVIPSVTNLCAQR